MDRALLTCPLAVTLTGPEVAPSGTRATTKSSELMTMAPSTSLNWTRGRFSSAGRKLLPLMRISPPGNADEGERLSMCGLPLTFFFPNRRFEIPMPSSFLPIRAGLMAEQAEMQKKLHNGQTIEAGRDIVHHNAGSFRQFFQLPYRVWFHDIEGSKKYKARQKRFPNERCTNESNQLSGGLVDDNKLRIFDTGGARDPGRCGNSDPDGESREQKIDRKYPTGGQKVRNDDPDSQRGYGTPGAWPGFQSSRAKKRGHQ